MIPFDYTKEVNWALILGICIPVGVLLIVGIALFIYCKRKRSKKFMEQKIKEESRFTLKNSFELNNYHKDYYTLRPFEELTTDNNQ